VQLHPEVAEALATGAPVVALESTIISHGLPRPSNVRIAREIEAAVRAAGAVPATIAVVDGIARIGLDDEALTRIANSDGVVKASVRDLATVAARGGDGATTVAATAHLAAQAGIAVFATGGLGGVHRGARETWDESADLTTLGRTRIMVVCAGVKSILDVAATLERLETLNIALLGYRTDAFPGFYLADSGYPVPWRVDSAAEAAAVLAARPALGTEDFGILLANPISAADQLDPALHERTLADGLAAAAATHVTGKDVTPFLLGYFNANTGGAALAANVALVLSNARLAGEVAVEYARRHSE
jgi:pseudouridine-5'-phosphate glycosidase